MYIDMFMHMYTHQVAALRCLFIASPRKQSLETGSLLQEAEEDVSGQRPLMSLGWSDPEDSPYLEGQGT